MALSFRRYGVAVKKGIYVKLLLLFRFPGEQRYVNLVHFGKHGAPILASTSHVRWQKPEVVSPTSKSCQESKEKNSLPGLAFT